MKNIFKYIILLLLIFAHNNQAEQIAISIDPRIELISIIQYLSAPVENKLYITPGNFTYIESVNRYFSKYRNDPVLELYRKLSSLGFVADIPPSYMLYFTLDNNTIRRVQEIPDSLTSRINNPQELTNFQKSLIGFYIKTHFVRFIKQNAALYQQITQEVQTNKTIVDIVSALSNYIGNKSHSYRIILSPLLSGNFSHWVSVNNGLDVYCISGPYRAQDMIPKFAHQYYRNAVLHEYLHPNMDALASKFSNQIAARANLYENISPNIKQYYGNWESCFKEHLINAIVLRIVLQNSSDQNTEIEAIQYEKKRGFIYIEPIVLALRQYENNRKLYPNFDAFIPVLLKIFNDNTK